jgi:hypothetical protein
MRKMLVKEFDFNKSLPNLLREMADWLEQWPEQEEPHVWALQVREQKDYSDLYKESLVWSGEISCFPPQEE